MQRTNFGEMACSIARTLDVIGEPWSPLVLRDVNVGLTRFEQIQADLGISRKVLTERLNHLVEQGVLERGPYDRRPRFEYVLTEKGAEPARSSAILPIATRTLMLMHAEAVDPTDTTWELHDPTYRVYLWTVLVDRRSAPTSSEWRITNAPGAQEVLDWAEDQRGERTYELFVEHTERRLGPDGWSDAPGLIRLAGTSPVQSTSVTLVFRTD
jgi:DNA-binding HxlR family transcriptional regulator